MWSRWWTTRSASRSSRPAKTVLAAGLGAEATRTASLQALAGSSDPPREADLEALLERIQDGAWHAMSEVAPELLALIVGHLEAQVAMIAKAIEEGLAR